jgi:GntR family transcriptional regulator
MPQLEDLLATVQQLGLSQQGLQQLIVKHWPRTKE